MCRYQRTVSLQSVNMARAVPIIRPGDVISYSMGNCDYVSVVISIRGFDRHGYVEIEIYDLVTPSNINFPPATINDPVAISINPTITDITVHSYDSYFQEHPELFL